MFQQFRHASPERRGSRPCQYSLGILNLHICVTVTSRPKIDIRATPEPLASLRLSLHNQSGQMKDIVDYISSVVHSDTKMRKCRKEEGKPVTGMLSEKVDGVWG